MRPKGVEQTDHEGLFKKLLRTFFLEFVDVFLPEMAEYLDRGSIEFLDKEVSPELDDKASRRADLVVKARFRKQELFFLIHIESQASRRPRFNRRMFFYTAWLDKTFDLPVYPIALLTWDKPLTPDAGQYTVEFPDRRVLEFNYAVIQLNRLDWRDFRHRDNPAASALMAKMGVRPEERGQVMLACLRMIARLNPTPHKLRAIQRFLTSYLPLDGEALVEVEKETKTFEPKERKTVMEIVNNWELRGLNKGKVEGKLEGKREAVFKVLSRRLGEINLATQKRINKLTLEKLDELFDAAFDFDKKAALNEWLRKHASA